MMEAWYCCVAGCGNILLLCWLENSLQHSQNRNTLVQQSRKSQHRFLQPDGPLPASELLLPFAFAEGPDGRQEWLGLRIEPPHGVIRAVAATDNAQRAQYRIISS